MKIAIAIDIFHDNEAKIAEYVRKQLQEDIMSDQISIKEYFEKRFSRKEDSHLSGCL